MKIVVLGAGKMGTWLCDALCLDHEVAVYDPDIRRLSYVFNTIRMVKPEEIETFEPEMAINAANLQHTEDAFRNALPFLKPSCILADIASVKNGIHQFYLNTGRPFVSVHPMFGPTFASLNDLSRHHAIIITESDEQGKGFFRNFFGRLGLKLHELSFEGHDQTIAYSLSVPFASSLVFASCMQPQEAPGTTIEKHLAIARGLLSEDDHLLGEILFNPNSNPMLEKISEALEQLKTILENRDYRAMADFLKNVRSNLV
jgi:prephenate dehydrogenase